MNHQKILETHAREIQRRREVAQTTLRQLADRKVMQNTVALLQTSSCTGYSATADLQFKSKPAASIHLLLHVHEKCLKVLWRKKSWRKTSNTMDQSF